MAAIDFKYRVNWQPYTGEIDDVAVQKFIVEQKKLKQYSSWVDLATNIGKTAGKKVRRLSRVAEGAAIIMASGACL